MRSIDFDDAARYFLNFTLTTSADRLLRLLIVGDIVPINKHGPGLFLFRSHTGYSILDRRHNDNSW